MLKRVIKFILNYFQINRRRSIVPGISIFGTNIFIDDRQGEPKFRSVYALDYIKKLKPKNVIDVGSGGGYHANELKNIGAKVTCVDYGTSIYAAESIIDNCNVVTVDFNKYFPSEKFEIVWASHVLEHQRNIGHFIEKLISCCADNGFVCITIPDPHRNLWGGHLSQLSPGLLAYNVVLCGVDLSTSIFIRGTNEFSLLFKPIKIDLPSNLTFDTGDLKKLAIYLPQGFNENADPWKIKYVHIESE